MNEEVAFYILSAVAMLGALVAVRRRNLVHGVFALMIFFAALAGLFLLLLAEFIAAVQVLVYIGAVGILLLFAIMLTERVTGDDARRVTSRNWLWGFIAATAVLAVLFWALSNVDIGTTKAEIDPSVSDLGKTLMQPYVVTLEVLALLLTAALIGAVAAAQGAIAIEKIEKKEEESDDA